MTTTLNRALWMAPLLALVLGLMTFAGISTAEAKGATATRERIALAPSSAFPSAKGKADFKVKGSERQLEVEVENIRSLAGQQVSVSVGGVVVANPTVTSLGQASVNLNSQTNPATPLTTAGKLVEVRTSAGVLIASGAFK